MAGTSKTVKDVPSHEFVRAYAAHLKRSGKVSVTCPSPGRWGSRKLIWEVLWRWRSFFEKLNGCYAGTNICWSVIVNVYRGSYVWPSLGGFPAARTNVCFWGHLLGSVSVFQFIFPIVSTIWDGMEATSFVSLVYVWMWCILKFQRVGFCQNNNVQGAGSLWWGLELHQSWYDARISTFILNVNVFC